MTALCCHHGCHDPKASPNVRWSGASTSCRHAGMTNSLRLSYQCLKSTVCSKGFMVKDLLKPVKIPSVWRYSESWCDRKIESVYDLNKLCKNRDAEFDIQYFLYRDAQRYYNNIKTMNAWIQRLSIEEIDNMPPDDIDSLMDKLPGDSGDSNLKRTHWISEHEIKMNVAN